MSLNTCKHNTNQICLLLKDTPTIIHHHSAVVIPSETPSSSLNDKQKHLAIDSNNEPGHPKPDLAPKWPKMVHSWDILQECRLYWSRKNLRAPQ